MKITLQHTDHLSVEYGHEKVRITAVDGVLQVTRTVASCRVPPFDADRDVVRVSLPGCSRPYAYSCPGARIGDMVRVVLPGGDPLYARVVGLGRGVYDGPLKKAELVRVPQ